MTPCILLKSQVLQGKECCPQIPLGNLRKEPSRRGRPTLAPSLWTQRSSSSSSSETGGGVGPPLFLVHSLAQMLPTTHPLLPRRLSAKEKKGTEGPRPQHGKAAPVRLDGHFVGQMPGQNPTPSSKEPAQKCKHQLK